MTIATDSIVYRSEVSAASNTPSDGWTDGDTPSSPPRSLRSASSWGGKAVLILIGVRLGLDGVNPIYHDSIKVSCHQDTVGFQLTMVQNIFTFPQSVGIAGGRPSSSYYFVGSQANSLFYLDPHFTRPAVPLVTPPAPALRADSAPSPVAPSRVRGDDRPNRADKSVDAAYTLDVVDVDDVSMDSDSDTSSPSNRVRRNPKTSPAAKRLSAHKTTLPGAARHSATPPTHRRTPSDPFGGGSGTASTSSGPSSPRQSAKAASVWSRDGFGPVDPQSLWYASAYSETQLRSFHCEKVKKMPLSGLDPSMLLGFLVRNEADFEDFCQRTSKVSGTAPVPSWDDILISYNTQR